MDYRRNEDKIVYPDCNYNCVHLVEDTSEGSPADAVVTLQEVKDYLRLEGWQSDDDSPGDDFDFDDVLLDAMIEEGTQWVEKMSGVHLRPKTLHVVLSNGAGLINIPGPVTGAITVTDRYDVAITGMETIGDKFKKVVYPRLPLMQLTYPAGYVTCPEWAKNAVKAYIADHYEYRGDDAPPAANKRAMQILRPHRRIVAWA